MSVSRFFYLSKQLTEGQDLAADLTSTCPQTTANDRPTNLEGSAYRIPHPLLDF